MFKILSGDFPESTQLQEVLGKFTLNKLVGWKIEKIGLNDNIERIELMTEEKAKSFLGAAGLGLVGGLVFGPVGALAGILAGGNKKEICFACYFKDGTKFMAVADPKTYQKLVALTFENPEPLKETQPDVIVSVDLKLCRFCKKEININARKCGFCWNSFDP